MLLLYLASSTHVAIISEIRMLQGYVALHACDLHVIVCVFKIMQMA